MSIYLFRNSLVFHKIDMMTSLGIHFMPMATMYHIKWYTIVDQAHLPADQQRFVNLQFDSTWI